jgi:hypothetical protein
MNKGLTKDIEILKNSTWNSWNGKLSYLKNSVVESFTNRLNQVEDRVSDELEHSNNNKENTRMHVWTMYKSSGHCEKTKPMNYGHRRRSGTS